MPKSNVASWVLAGLLALAFGFVGFLKLSTSPMEVAVFTHFGYPLWFMYVIGTIELAGALGLVCGRLIDARLPRMAAIGLLIVMTGAIGSHLMFDPLSLMLPAVVLSALLLGFLYANKPVVV